jgi:NADPH:quinone reductase
MTSLPSHMRALELTAYDGPTSLRAVTRPVPSPAGNQVLVRIAAAPVNPSDLMFMRGTYGLRKPLPVVPGFEASGVIVASSGGLPGRVLLGRRVACGAPDDGDGTWAEYMRTPWNRCVPLRAHVNTESGANLLVNPLTAFVLMDMARRSKHHAVVQTAAASALGRMLVRLSIRFGITLINIVRRQEQVALLRALGATHSLNSSDPDFDAQLTAVCKSLDVRLAFDAVGGEITGRVLRALQRGGRVLIYGTLAEQPCVVEPRTFLFEDKRVEGFWMADWFPRQPLLYQLTTAMRAQNLLSGELKTDIRERIPLEGARARSRLTRTV